MSSRARSAAGVVVRCRWKVLVTLAAAVLAPAACADDAPLTSPADATARLAITARVSPAGSLASTVAIRVSYLRAAVAGAAAPQEVALLTRELSIGTGQQQVPIAVDLTRCLADRQRASPTSSCQLRVVVRLLVDQTVVDSVALAPIAVRPGETATVPEPVQLVAVASITVTALLAGTFDGPVQPFVIAGRTLQLVATARDANGNVLTGRAMNWASTNTTTATVSPTSGIVSGLFPGNTTVTATSGVASGQLAVAVFAQSLTVTPDTGSVIVGRTFQLTATVLDANKNVLSGVPITWQTSAPGMATVSPTGLVTGVSTGPVGSVAPPPVTITATGGGAFGTARVRVLSAPVR